MWCLGKGMASAETQGREGGRSGGEEEQEVSPGPGGQPEGFGVYSAEPLEGFGKVT